AVVRWVVRAGKGIIVSTPRPRRGGSRNLQQSPPLYDNIPAPPGGSPIYPAATTRQTLMRAAFIETTGSPDVIRVGELPTSTPKQGEVLVRIAASSLNPIDIYIRAGTVAMPLPKPFIPGCDLAGTVEAVGPGVGRFKVGDRVWGTNQGLLGRQGTLAEYAAVNEDWLYPTPQSVS